jgi:predicted transcriptional regulator of viral defense system
MAAVSEYIVDQLAKEQYAFSWKELTARIPKTEAALKNELARLVKKKEIVHLRAGFYIIIPPRYRSYGKLPVELYIDKLFLHLKKPYYLAFYSAATFHGAGHQQVQRDYLVTKVPNMPDVKKGPVHLKIFAASNWPEKNILQKKSDAGYFKISSPALTAADLIHYQTKVGGINRVITAIEELAETITSSDLQDLLSWYPHVSTLQRLGYLLEQTNVENEAIQLISKNLKQQRHYPVLLSPEKGQRPGSTGNPWKVDVNVKIESDL